MCGCPCVNSDSQAPLHEDLLRRSKPGALDISHLVFKRGPKGTQQSCCCCCYKHATVSAMHSLYLLMSVYGSQTLRNCTMKWTAKDFVHVCPEMTDFYLKMKGDKVLLHFGVLFLNIACSGWHLTCTGGKQKVFNGKSCSYWHTGGHMFTLSWQTNLLFVFLNFLLEDFFFFFKYCLLISSFVSGND